MLVKEREPREARTRDGHLEVIAAAGAILDAQFACVGKRVAEELDAAALGYAALGTRFHEAATLVELAELTGAPLPADARATLERLDAKPWLARADAAERAVTV